MRKLLHGLLLFSFLARVGLAASPPKLGDKAPDFSLPLLHGTTMTLSELTDKTPVVLVVLRGYPGYQCPVCNRQVRDFLNNAAGFADAGVAVVLVYPGPGGNLEQRAAEFAQDKVFPENFHLLLDPAYTFTNIYGLRWEAPNETAYPATFLIEQGGEIFFVKVSDSHGGRTTAAEILAKLP